MQGIEKKILIIVLMKLWSGDAILSLSDARISDLSAISSNPAAPLLEVSGIVSDLVSDDPETP